MEVEANSEGLNLELPKEEKLATTVKAEITETAETADSRETSEITESSQNDSKALGESQMEEVRIESVDLNTINISESDKKDNPRFSLEKFWLYLRNAFSYYTSCSTKKQQTNINKNQPN